MEEIKDAWTVNIKSCDPTDDEVPASGWECDECDEEAIPCICKCGQPSTCFVMSVDAYSHMCGECMYGKNVIIETLLLKMPE